MSKFSVGDFVILVAPVNASEHLNSFDGESGIVTDAVGLAIEGYWVKFSSAKFYCPSHWLVLASDVDRLSREILTEEYFQ